MKRFAIHDLENWKERPSVLNEKTTFATSSNVDYRFVSLPLYLIGQLGRLLENQIPRSTK